MYFTSNTMKVLLAWLFQLSQGGKPPWLSFEFSEQFQVLFIHVSTTKFYQIIIRRPGRFLKHSVHRNTGDHLPEITSSPLLIHNKPKHSMFHLAEHARSCTLLTTPQPPLVSEAINPKPLWYCMAGTNLIEYDAGHCISVIIHCELTAGGDAV